MAVFHELIVDVTSACSGVMKLPLCVLSGRVSRDGFEIVDEMGLIE